jgi:hypothetical protein
MENNLDWFRSQIRKRIYKVEGPKTDPEARDGIFVQDQEHARRLYESGQKYSRTKRWY